MSFNLRYFYGFLIILLVEVSIAMFVNDAFIRPFIGDILVVVLLYFFVRTLVNAGKMLVITSVLLFAYLVELGQYFNLVSLLGLQDNGLARIVVGSTFDFFDLLAYTIGALILIPSYFSS